MKNKFFVYAWDFFIDQMRVLKRGAMFAALMSACALLTTGCVHSYDIYEVHGKCGVAVSYVFDPPAVVVELAFLPILYPVFSDTNKSSVIGFPYRAIDFIGYCFGAGLTYPAYFCCVLPFKDRMPEGVSDKEKIAWLVESMPLIDERNYQALLLLSRREFAPAYLRFPPPPDMTFGLKDMVYGESAKEWKEWMKAGCPSGGAEERRFVINYWLHNRPSLPIVKAESYRILWKSTGIGLESITAWGNRHGMKTGYIEVDVWKRWIDEHGGIDNLVSDIENAKAELNSHLEKAPPR